MLKKYIKLNNMLDNYNLLLDTKEGEVISWKLYKRYDDSNKYFSEENVSIMTSEESSYEDLVKFAKKHRKYDIPLIMLKSNVFINGVVYVILLLNIFFRDDCVKGFILGVILMTTLSSTMIGTMEEKNFRVKWLEYEE